MFKCKRYKSLSYNGRMYSSAEKEHVYNEHFAETYGEYTIIQSKVEALCLLNGDEDLSGISHLTFKKSCNIDDDYIRLLSNRQDIKKLSTLVVKGNKRITTKSIEYLRDSPIVCCSGEYLCVILDTLCDEFNFQIDDTGIDISSLYNKGGYLNDYPKNTYAWGVKIYTSPCNKLINLVYSQTLSS